METEIKMNEFITSSLKGFYPYFAIPAFIIVIYRVRKKLWTRSESLLLLFVILHLVFEALQILIGARTLYMSRRYLLPCAPLLFGWCAWGIAEFHHHLKSLLCPGGRIAFNIILFILAVILLIDGLMPTVKSYTSPEKSHKRKIVETLTPLLREDYKGVRFTPRPTEASRYQAPFRPIVASRYPALGYWSGGSHVPEEESYYDYLVKEVTAIPPTEANLKFKVEISGRSYGVYVSSRPVYIEAGQSRRDGHLLH